MTTEFSKVCEILGELYINYKEDKDFKDFVDFNDIGLPLAYFASEGLCEIVEDATRYVTETWSLFLAGLKLEDEGWDSLEEILASAEEKYQN